jgi:hypothetical protein
MFPSLYGPSMKPGLQLAEAGRWSNRLELIDGVHRGTRVHELGGRFEVFSFGQFTAVNSGDCGFGKAS